MISTKKQFKFSENSPEKTVQKTCKIKRFKTGVKNRGSGGWREWSVDKRLWHELHETKLNLYDCEENGRIIR